MPSTPLYSHIDDDFIIVDCVIPEGIGILSPFIIMASNEQVRRNSISHQWRNNRMWSFDLQILEKVKFCISITYRTNGI